MLLVEITINSVVNYVSILGHGLTHNWRPRIIGFENPTLATPSNHGGYAKMSFGRISFSQELFATDWPPPRVCPIAIYYTDTTEAARELVFEGTAILASWNQEQIDYGLFCPEYDETIAAATAYNDTLNVVITAILTAIPEITTVDTTFARVSSPNVTHTLANETIAIDLASAIAEFYSHLIYIVGSTAYLVDMHLDNGTWTLTEFEFFSFPTYSYETPISSILCGQVKRFSFYPVGTELSVTAYHTTEANIITAVDDIMSIENAARVSLDVPMIAGNFPSPGRRIVIPDTAHIAGLASWIRARKITFDFVASSIKIEGEGVVAAA